MTSHNNLANYYKTIFSMVQHHRWPIDAVENMMVFERDIYTTMILQTIRQT